MGIPHPPGAPLLSLIGRVASIIPFYDFRGYGFEHIAYRINLIAVITASLTIMLFYLVAVKLMKRIPVSAGTPGREGVIMFAAAVASLAAAFSHQFWENATETETYMPSLFLSMSALWLTLRWAERKEHPGAVRYLFLASYILGLGNGIHLYVMLMVPTLVLVAAFEKPEWFRDRRFLAGAGVLFAVLAAFRILGGRQIFYTFMALSALGGPYILMRLYRKESRRWKITLIGLLACISFFVIGYSVYPTIMVRASKKPAINEGNPDTWKRYMDYLDRKQYVRENMYLGMLRRKADPAYQFGFMYFRYLLRQFPKWGPSPAVAFTNDRSADYPGRTVHVREEAYFPVALWLILLFGAYLHARRDVKRFAPFFLYFLATSVGLVLYLNMENPEARDRGYFFLGSFHIIMVWLGIGIHGVLAGLRERLERGRLKNVAAPVTAAAFLLAGSIVPASMLSNHIDPEYTNYRVHDRSGNVIPFEFGYNILVSCDRDAILFTHGDNDTYPVWYAQEVMGIRRDVRVVNLSLLNAPWYIKQLRDEGVTVPITLTDEFIDERLTGDSLTALRTLQWSAGPKEVTMAGLTWKMPPTYPPQGGGNVGFLSVASFMTAHIIKTVNWSRPIYFAVTVAPATLIGLDRYMSSEGMVFRLTREKAEKGYNINVPAIERNLSSRYRFTGVTDPRVYKPPETVKLLQNYFVCYKDLCLGYLDLGRTEDAIRAAREGMTRTNPDLDRRIMFYRLLLENGLGDEASRMIGEEAERLPLEDLEASVSVGLRFLEYGMGGPALPVFEKIVEAHPESELAWKAYISALYRAERYDEALSALEKLLKIVPGDVEALRLRDMIKNTEGNTRSLR